MKLIDILLEAYKKPHFNDRVYDRLNSPFTTFSDEDSEVKKLVLNYIEILSHITFKDQDNIGIILYKSPKYYKYEKVNDKGEIEKSEGNFIWVILRGNDLETVIFNRNGFKPGNTQMHFKIEDIIRYIRDVKKGNLTLDSKDLKRINTYNYNAPVADPKESEPIFNIEGVKWVLTQDKKYLVKKNNPNYKITIEDAIELVSDADAERLINLI